MKYSRRGKRPIIWALPLFGLAYLFGACGGSTGASSGSETNWLSECTSDSECGKLSCHCAVCTRSCETDAECQSVQPGSVCAVPNTARHDAVCTAGHDTGVCVTACVSDDDCVGSAMCDAGVCRPAVGSKKPAGSACDAGEECLSGVCEGEGCGAAQGVCAPEERLCTEDAMTYCGCDGTSFVSSGSCPGNRYLHTGGCETSGSCDSTGDCPPNSICEGQGCGPGEGTCVPVDRGCTDDEVTYCGCDGQTFSSSGSCPGARYERIGVCQAAPTSCDSDADCPAGSLCEGQGCGANQGVCAEIERSCTADLVSYCGCDGVTFNGSSSCPGGRYARTGACEDAPLGCDTNADCPEGSACEGPGCGEGQGVCAPLERACTLDAAAYCGCNGETFYASGSCPGARFEYPGACSGDGAEGSACDVGADCQSGVCEGQGCGEGEGVCAAVERVCTDDLASYCGCDGVTFQSSGSCPGARFEHTGACE